MNNITEGIISIASLIVGIAALAIILSPKATTSQVIQASASGFVNALATAEAPVTGSTVNIVSAYPNSNNGGMGLPTLGTLGLPALG
jgi:hypothetical protein